MKFYVKSGKITRETSKITRIISVLFQSNETQEKRLLSVNRAMLLSREFMACEIEGIARMIQKYEMSNA
jgi:hypothetical protein